MGADHVVALRLASPVPWGPASSKKNASCHTHFEQNLHAPLPPIQCCYIALLGNAFKKISNFGSDAGMHCATILIKGARDRAWCDIFFFGEAPDRTLCFKQWGIWIRLVVGQAHVKVQNVSVWCSYGENFVCALVVPKWMFPGVAPPPFLPYPLH